MSIGLIFPNYSTISIIWFNILQRKYETTIESTYVLYERRNDKCIVSIHIPTAPPHYRRYLTTHWLNSHILGSKSHDHVV